MSYIPSNVKKITEGQKLTFRLICQDGKRTEFSINPEFVRIPNEDERHNIGVQLRTTDLPDGVEFVIDNTTIQRDTSNPDAGVIVRGNHNECVVSFNGEKFPLFSVAFGDVSVQFSVDAKLNIWNLLVQPIIQYGLGICRSNKWPSQKL